MLYQKPKFSVPASVSSKEPCEPDKHPMADKKGRCLKCGQLIRNIGFNIAEGEE